MIGRWTDTLIERMISLLAERPSREPSRHRTSHAAHVWVTAFIESEDDIMRIGMSARRRWPDDRNRARAARARGQARRSFGDEREGDGAGRRRTAPRASHGTFADAAAFGEIVFNCTSGMVSLDALELAGAANLDGKPLVDVANPLDFSRGMPPTLRCATPSRSPSKSRRRFPARTS